MLFFIITKPQQKFYSAAGFAAMQNFKLFGSWTWKTEYGNITFVT